MGKNKKPFKISFVVPAFNEEIFITKCIESILKIKNSQDELIVVDNGSTDSTLSILANYPHITTLSYPLKNISAVRNFGAQHATGDLIAFIDADCTVANNWRRAVVSSIVAYSADGVGSKVIPPQNCSWIESAWLSQKSNISEKVRYLNSGNFIIRASIFKAIGGFNESLVTGEDSEIGWRINNAGFLLMDCPEIMTIHWDNPKDIKSFYHKEKWHAQGMLGTFAISFVDLPLLSTVFFIVSQIFAICLSILCVLENFYALCLCLIITSLFFIPVCASLYRCYKFPIWKNFFKLIILYLVYYIARSSVLLKILYKYLQNRFSMKLKL
jgi:glycosyltransferase involved in cell wall biosynthesis